MQDGFPSPEDEALCDVLSIEGYLIARSESFFLLKVSGDSMNGIVTAVIRKYKR
ncbi:MAG: S24 family peptidase [Syntrophobacterales bacterium]|nr:S24 family peptidase [Syntrophobacterales bacterium]